MKYRSLFVLLLLAVIAGSTPAFAQRELTEIPVPDPEIERATFEVAEGLEVNLFAADPLLAKPIQMNFDAEGRLWVASSEIYPHIKPGEKANDKIIVLEDADGDGVADKTNVFADGLLIPTGVEPGDGGAYVANSTELVHLTDTDGDGKADQRRVVLSGFGTEDTHHILHTFRWGNEGLLYFNQSIYIHSHIETPHGVRRLLGGGIWYFRPETMQLEVLMKGLVNSWGHSQDRFGQSFATDGAGGEGINYVFPGSVFLTSPGAKRILKGLNPGSPKHCGLEAISGSHFPDDWQGNMITNDFRAHRVCRFVLSEDGSGYSSREEVEVIKSSHVAFRPIDVKMGPDGALYIADWYNPIIQHGEVDFRDPRRDHTHGRIWRVTVKDRPLVKRPQLVQASTEELLDHLKAGEDWTRHFAQRVLKERGAKEVLAKLDDWVPNLDAADPDYDHHRLEALWTYQALDLPNATLLNELLRASDHKIRAAATRVLMHWNKRIENAVQLLAVQVADDHPRVRLEAIRALAMFPDAYSMELALRALDRPMDENLDFALWTTARDLAPHWLPKVQAGELTFGGNVRHLEFALRAAESTAAVQPLVAMLQSGQVPPEREESVLQLIAALGSPQEMGLVYSMAVVDNAATPARQTALLRALSEATRQRKVRPEGDLTTLGQFLASADAGLSAAAARAIGLWEVEPLRAELNRLAAASDTPETVRAAAITAIADLGGEASLETLRQLTAASQPAATRSLATVAMAALDLNTASNRAAEMLAEPKAIDPSLIVAGFLERKGGPAALVAAIGDKSISEDTAKLAVRAARASALPDEALIQALQHAGKLMEGTKPLTPAELEQMVNDVKNNGDPARGEAIFRRAEQACLKCHAIGGAGGQVGPDLVSVGASAQVDYLIESILEPTKKVKENYHSLVVATDDGQMVTGIKVRDTGTELILRNAEDQEIAIPLDTIDEQENGGSMMPVGLSDTLTRDELVDLVRFMSELGKVGPYSLGNVRVVRRWQTLEPDAAAVAAAGADAEAIAKNANGLLWSSVYSQVSGALPLANVKPVETANGDRIGWVRFQLEVTTPGAVQLGLNSAEGIRIWVDGKAVEASDSVVLELARGQRNILLAVDMNRRRDQLRCELQDVENSPARAQIVTGK